MIELKEDNPDAVEYLLRYMYSGQSETDEDDKWQLQLEIAKTAQKVCRVIPAEQGTTLTSNKYLLLDLAAIAKEKFMKVANAVIRPEDVFATITHIRQNTLESDHLEVAQQLETKHRFALLKLPGYRAVIDQDKSTMWNNLDQLLDFLSSQEEVELGNCPHCRKSTLLRRGQEDGRCQCCNRSIGSWQRRVLWIPKGEFDKFHRLV